MLDGVRDWTEGEVLGLDFETTGVDRFTDVPVSYALVSVVDGMAVRSWSGLIDPGREIPSDATAVHGITTERARSEGMPLDVAIALVSDAVVSAGRRGVPVVGMKLDYDLTILDVSGEQVLRARVWSARGWCGPGARRRGARPSFRRRTPRGGGRSATSARTTGSSSRTPTTRRPTPWPSVEVLFALAARYDALRDADVTRLHEAQIEWHRRVDRGLRRVAVEPGHDRRSTRGTTCGRSRRWPCRPRRDSARSVRSAALLEQVPHHVDALVLGRGRPWPGAACRCGRSSPL